MPLFLQPLHYVANHVPLDIADYVTQHFANHVTYDISDNVTDSVPFDLAHHSHLPWVHGARQRWVCSYSCRWLWNFRIWRRRRRPVPLLLQPVHYVANHVPHDIPHRVANYVPFDISHRHTHLPWVHGARQRWVCSYSCRWVW